MEQEEIQTIKNRFGIIGTSPKLNRDIEVAVQVARTDLSVLVTGESGVGKEHFPQIIHQYSARKHGPYFAVNCGAIPEGTIESELFGHEKGAFTDARAERKGYFEIADGGTLFLDEVGELPIAMQAKLLRVLETGEYLRMGSSATRRTNVRVVAATNLDMHQAIINGKFREDLYYRLNTVEIHVPALRERKEDIPVLFRKFSTDFSNRYQMPAIRLSEDAKSLLMNYYWRGNIRQLKNIAETVTLMEHDKPELNALRLQNYLPDNERETGLVLAGNHSQETHMPHEQELLMMMSKMRQEMNEMQKQLASLTNGHTILSDTQSASQTSIVIQSGSNITDHDTEEAQAIDVTNARSATNLKEIEKETIIKALEQSEGNRKVAAAVLGMPERTLYRRIKDYEINL